MFNSKKTVASVMAAFTRTIDDLKQVAAENRAEAERQERYAQEARDAANAALREVADANAIVGKLEALVSGTAVEGDCSAACASRF